MGRTLSVRMRPAALFPLRKPPTSSGRSTVQKEFAAVWHMSVEEEVDRTFVHDDHTLGQKNLPFG